MSHDHEDAETRITLALNVQNLRQASGLSIRELSARSGVAPATICRIENATHGTTLRRLTSLAAGLGVSVADLLTPSEEGAGDAE